ncbi:MAG: tellurite resistance TerB family protein [Cyanobacteriota bacterium]
MDVLMSPAEAFAAIALAAVACDGSVDPHEAALLRTVLEGRHPYLERSEESMGRLFEGLLDQLHAEGWRELISRAIPALSLSQRETALAMAAHLIHGDRKVSAEEVGLLAELAAQMGLPDDRGDQILEVIAVLHRDSLDPRSACLGD